MDFLFIESQKNEHKNNVTIFLIKIINVFIMKPKIRIT